MESELSFSPGKSGEKRLWEEGGSAPGQLTLLAPRAVVAGLASAGAVPLVTVLRVLLHALALLGAAGAERPLGASWVGRRRTASDPGGQISQTGDRTIATTQH